MTSTAFKTLNDPPTDTVSNLVYRDSEHLLASSWDNHIAIYNPKSDINRVFHYNLHSPVTKSIWDQKDTSKCFAITLDGKLHNVNTSTNTSTLLGDHQSGLTCLVQFNDHHVFTGGWNGHLNCWDERIGDTPSQQVTLNSKIVALDCFCDDTSLAVATIDQLIHIFDYRDLHTPLTVMDSQLKHMTRSLVCLPDQLGFAFGSVEGRVAFEFLNSTGPYTRFAFKCHRQTVDQTEYVYPVNSIAFHPKHTMTFATGGGDGVVSIWDGIKKKRIRALPKQLTSISSVSFSESGDQLAMAVSYTYEQGDQVQQPPEAILIRDIADADVLPRK